MSRKKNEYCPGEAPRLENALRLPSIDPSGDGGSAVKDQSTSSPWAESESVPGLLTFKKIPRKKTKDSHGPAQFADEDEATPVETNPMVRAFENVIARKRARRIPELETRIVKLEKRLAPLDSQPDIVKRRAIIKQNHLLQARALCQLFDSNHIPLPKSMQEAQTWNAAYRAPLHHHAIDSLIARDRKKTDI